MEHYTRYFRSVFGNALFELCIEGVDPVPCEVIIPMNIIPQAPEKMVALALAQNRQRKDITQAGEPVCGAASQSPD